MKERNIIKQTRKGENQKKELEYELSAQKSANMPGQVIFNNTSSL